MLRRAPFPLIEARRDWIQVDGATAALEQVLLPPPRQWPRRKRLHQIRLELRRYPDPDQAAAAVADHTLIEVVGDSKPFSRVVHDDIHKTAASLRQSVSALVASASTEVR